MSDDDTTPASPTDTQNGADGSSSASPTTKKTTPSWGHKDTLGCLAILAFLLVLAAAWGAGFGVVAVVESVIRGRMEWWLVALALVVPLVVLRARPRASLTVAVVAALIAAGYALGVHPWRVATVYAGDVQQTADATDYRARAPWVVAENYASREQGEVVGNRLRTHYVPESDGAAEVSRYTVLIERRAPLRLAGLEAVQELRTPVTGAVPGSASGHCTVPEGMNRRIDSFWPWHSLRYAIWLQKPNAHFTAADAYGYCDGDSPVVVVPLWAYDGWFAVTKRPDGAAVYDASGLRILSAEELGDVEGPTYPRTLAEAQRVALRGDGTLTGYWSAVTGYDTTAKDAEDANVGNTTEFTHVTGDGADLHYLTPLTPRGTSESITAVSVVPARQSASERAPLVVNSSPNLPATSTLATRIKESSVQGDVQWTNRWAAGMGVYEILPGRDGHWVASIGQGQAVSYRADIAPDGSVDVVNVETGASSRTEAPQDDDSPTTDRPLSEMSREELLQLILEATQELQRQEGTENQDSP
ncbi:MAG: hypothetical protein Q4G43_01615 [Mobilicoccus sp.]|nr:hypothetical protein [Mobilicoccus sp.]